jgi:uncharacterized protein YebE (UPF0316 family)
MLPILVFLAETCVVTLTTLRTIFVSRGWKGLAPVLGFFEVSIWMFAIGQVMRNLDRPDCFLAFAGGFSLGNYLGIVIEQKLALGHVVVHVTTHKQANELAERLREDGHGATVLDAKGATGSVQVTFTVVRRKELSRAIAVIRQFDPTAFYSVNELQQAVAGVFPRPVSLSGAVVRARLTQILRPGTRPVEDEGQTPSRNAG